MVKVYYFNQIIVQNMSRNKMNQTNFYVVNCNFILCKELRPGARLAAGGLSCFEMEFCFKKTSKWSKPKLTFHH